MIGLPPDGEMPKRAERVEPVADDERGFVQDVQGPLSHAIALPTAWTARDR